MTKKLTRKVTDKMLGGVASGLAEYFGLEAVWLRIAFALAAFGGGGGIIIYIILWIAIPEERFDPYAFNTDYKVYPDANNPGAYPNKKEPFKGSLLIGGIFIFLGFVFLLDEFDLIPNWFSIWKLWPLALVGLGAFFLINGVTKQNKMVDDEVIDYTTSENKETQNGSTNPDKDSSTTNSGNL